jgi:hypothetical protein
LDVPVQGCWKACALAAQIFEPDWTLESIPVWQVAEVTLPVVTSEVEVVERGETLPISA